MKRSAAAGVIGYWAFPNRQEGYLFRSQRRVSRRGDSTQPACGGCCL